MANIKFISYNGSYPNLCSGTLTIEVNGKEYSWDHALSSGGRVWFGSDWNEHVEDGEWSLSEWNMPDELQPYKTGIVRIVNENVPHGCCGGCV